MPNALCPARAYTATMRHTLLSALVLTLLAGCSGSGETSGDPLVDARNDKLANWRRVDAVREAWANADPVRRAGIRESLKDQMWSQQTPPEVRIAIIDTFAIAARAAGASLTTDSMVKALETNKIPADMFGSPPMQFKPNMRLSNDQSRMSQIQNGRWTKVTDYLPVPPPTK